MEEWERRGSLPFSASMIAFEEIGHDYLVACRGEDVCSLEDLGCEAEDVVDD